MPTVYNGGQSPMEAAAIAARNTLLPRNVYNNYASANNYGATHTRAVSDSTTPIYGKGSGNFLDIQNYSGVGGEWDINGNAANSVGSGRNPQISLNAGLWGYGPSAVAGSNYTMPDMSLNVGQVII